MHFVCTLTHYRINTFLDMKIKICGMRNKDNIIQILSLKPDFIGFIFYEKSPRFVNSLHDFSEIQFDSKVKKTGVLLMQMSMKSCKR